MAKEGDGPTLLPADEHGLSPIGVYDGLSLMLRLNFRVSGGNADAVSYRIAKTSWHRVDDAALPFDRRGAEFQECRPERSGLQNGAHVTRYEAASWDDGISLEPVALFDATAEEAGGTHAGTSVRGNPMLLVARGDLASFFAQDEMRTLYARHRDGVGGELRGEPLSATRATEAQAELQDALDRLLPDEEAFFAQMRANYVDYLACVASTLAQTRLEVIGIRGTEQTTRAYEFGMAPDFAAKAGERFDAFLSAMEWRVDPATHRLVNALGADVRADAAGFPFWGCLDGELSGVEDERLEEPLFSIRAAE